MSYFCENRQIPLLHFHKNVSIICALQLFLLYTKIFRLYRKSCGEAIASPIIILISLSWEYPGQFFCRDAPTGSSCTVQNESLLPIPARYRSCCILKACLSGMPRQAVRTRCRTNRYCPYPLGIVTLSHAALKHCTIYRQCAAGRILKGGRLFLREQDLSASLKPVLWVLSYRHKKVPPPAGTGIIYIE